MDARSQNCLAKLASSSEEPANTSNPGEQISGDSFLLLGSSQDAVSMATEDASSDFLAPPHPPTLLPGKTAKFLTAAKANLQFPPQVLGVSAHWGSYRSPLLRRSQPSGPVQALQSKRRCRDLCCPVGVSVGAL